jgi:protein CLEC16A
VQNKNNTTQNRDIETVKMFGSSSAPLPPPPDVSASIASSENRFSLIELRRIYTQLLENKSVNEDNKSLVVEILRIIAEMVVYGDNKSELLFDFFCEKNMLSLFLEIMWTESGCPAVVHIQILQTLSILINCVRNDTSLYYLLSNNYINEIIIYPFAFASDENLCDQFASFMKSLSLKLNIQTVQFFFIEETGAFPILTRAIGLLDLAAEPMVRISSQATILNVYKVDDSRSREYALQEEVMHSLFVNVVKLMQNQHTTISGICASYLAESCGSNDEGKLTRLENQLEDVLASTEDWFYYLQDILDLKILVLRQALIHHLVNEFIYPSLLQPILEYRTSAAVKAETETSTKTSTPSKAPRSSSHEKSSQFTSGE